MSSEEETNSKSPKDIPEFIVYRPWTVQNVVFWFFLACYIPGLKLAELQEMLALPSYDLDLVGDFSDKATTGNVIYYMMWCKHCDIAKHPEYFEDRGRALRVMQKVKEREHDCRDMTWSTNDDPTPGQNSTNYVSSSRTVAFIAVELGTHPKDCTHKIAGYLRGIRGQDSGDVHGGIASSTTVLESSFGGMSDEIVRYQPTCYPS